MKGLAYLLFKRKIYIIVTWCNVKLIVRRQYYNIKHIANTINSIQEFQEVVYEISYISISDFGLHNTTIFPCIFKLPKIIYSFLFFIKKDIITTKSCFRFAFHVEFRFVLQLCIDFWWHYRLLVSKEYK